MSTRQREKAAKRREKKANRGPYAMLRNLHTSPRKVRLVIDMIRGRDVETALNILNFSPKGAAQPIRKLLQSAVANADMKGKWDLDKLFIKWAFVNEGPTAKRWLPRAHGRATRIRKRTSHVTVELAEKE